MNSPFLMNRLIQGDVGSGKTIVAAIALFFNYLLKKQGVIMVPSDTLARQHYVTFCQLFKGFPNISISLLVGSLKASEKKKILDNMRDGELKIVVGTHALFSKKVEYKDLGMIVIDEQHRFGTLQRNDIVKKSESNSDVLMMSATPIPRTLSLSLFGEIDVSYIEENPSASNRDVETKIYAPGSSRIVTTINQVLDDNKRVFIVAPKIKEDSFGVSAEEIYSTYNEMYPGKVQILHGKVDKSKQIQVMNDFISGKMPILISTTIVEVGLDIKDASLMIVYGAGNFGLASLHQLRGRIGRDGSPATFILVSNEENEKQKQRLDVIKNTTDGALIAATDLTMRGPGEIEGIKQSGSRDYKYIDPIADKKLIALAKLDADHILNNHSNPKYQYIIKKASETKDNLLSV